MLIDQKSIKGEAKTGYEAPEGKGPFECGNCHYFEGGLCDQHDMVRYSSQPLSQGKRKVDPKGCCEYVDRVGSRKGALARRAHG